MKAVDGLKRCSKCGDVKGVDNFYKNKKYSDGLWSSCKLCSKKQSSVYASKNREKMREYSKLYRLSNLEKFSRYSLKYNRKNKDSIREWYQNNREKILANRRINIQNINASRRRSCMLLKDSYVKTIVCKNFHIDRGDITPIMIELKRTQLINKRLIKNLKQK